MALGTYMLSALLTGLRRERPSAQITLTVSQPRAAMREVQTGEADIGVVSWDFEAVPGDLRIELLRREPLTLCASPDGPPGDEVPIVDLTALPHVGVPRTVALHHTVESQLRALDLPGLEVVIRLGHAESMKQAVIDHGWVCLLPHYCVADDIARGRLREVSIIGGELVEPISLIFHRDKRFSPLQAAVVELVRAQVGLTLAPPVTADG